MSGYCDISDCPNCGKDMNYFTDWKPFNISENWCIHCGFYTTTKVGQMTLEALNDYRKEWNENYEDEEDEEPLEMLTELPKCDTDFYY